MRALRRPGRIAAATLALITAGFGPALGGTSNADALAVDVPHRSSGLQVASRDDAQLYYQAYRLIGSTVLNLSGERIGEVEDLVIDSTGKVTTVMVALNEQFDMDGSPVPISPYRAEVVSIADSNVTIIRVDMTHEELVQAQLTRLKSDARAPVSRETDRPEPWRQEDPLF